MKEWRQRASKYLVPTQLERGTCLLSTGCSSPSGGARRVAVLRAGRQIRGLPALSV